MTKNQLKEHVKELKKLIDKHIDFCINRAISSGALDFSAESSASFFTAKTILSAVLEETADYIKPINSNKSEIENLRSFL